MERNRSFVVMRNRGIHIALTFDQHFIQAGFQALPNGESDRPRTLPILQSG